MRPSEPPKKRPRYFYGWNIVFASFLAHLSYAEHHSSVLGFFMRPLNQSFGWSRTEISVVQSIARFVEAGASFFVGPVIDNHGPRLLMPLGAIIISLFVGWKMQVEKLKSDLGFVSEFFFRMWLLLVRFLAPIAIFAIFISNFI